MNIRGNDYKTVPLAEVSVKQSKLLVQVSQAYDEYVKDEGLEGAKYDKLKALWKQMVETLVVNPNEEVKNFDNISVATYTEVMKSFFPESSEVKK